MVDGCIGGQRHRSGNQRIYGKRIGKVPKFLLSYLVQSFDVDGSFNRHIGIDIQYGPDPHPWAAGKLVTVRIAVIRVVGETLVIPFGCA